MGERNFNDIFSERLRYYLNKFEISQKELAKRLGVGTTSVYNWCNGIKTPRMDKVDSMCEIFHCQRSDLMTEQPTTFVSDAPTEYHRIKMVKIPLLGTVAAGVPISAIEDIQGYVEIPERWTHSGEYFALTIKGDSMFPDIHDGDIVIVKSQPVADNNDIVIASVNGDEATCKRLKRYETELCLVSNNPEYETMRFTPQEVDTLPVTILGKVVELRRKLV